MIKNYHPHSRFQIVERAFNDPGVDLVHNTPDGPFIDLGIDIDRTVPTWGYLKMSDAEEIGRVIGMIPRDEAQALIQRNAELEARFEALPQILEEFTSGLHSHALALRSNISAPVDQPVSSAEVPVESAPEQLELNLDKLDYAVSGVSGENEPDAEEVSGASGEDHGSSGVEGSNDVPDDSGDEFFSGLFIDTTPPDPRGI